MGRIEAMSQAGRWWYALKPLSWPKLLVPAILGQAAGYAATGNLSVGGLILGSTFTLFDLIFIVLLNDWGDREVDTFKRQMFPEGCSPKTIPDGILPAQQLLVAGLLAGLGALLVSVTATFALDLPSAGWLGAASLLVFLAYTFPPLALNYRGGGELLEMLGVGVLLPWFNAYLQSGQDALLAPWALGGFALLSLASALASGLSDEESDRRGGKHTFVTRFGNPAARRAIETLVALGAGCFFAASWLERSLIPPWGTAPAAALVGLSFPLLHRASPLAVTNAFKAQARYKQLLHRAVWGSALWMALTAVAKRGLES